MKCSSKSIFFFCFNLFIDHFYRDMAGIVGRQGTMVEEISKSTDSSHQKAQEGLRQVELASQHQAACIIS
jgi:hypothetical protein